MRELYVYYRVAEADVARVREAVSELQARLMRERPGLRARLLARPNAVDGRATFMETYAVGGADVDAALESRIAQGAAALAAPIDGPRHVEVFIALE